MGQRSRRRRLCPCSRRSGRRRRIPAPERVVEPGTRHPLPVGTEHHRSSCACQSEQSDARGGTYYDPNEIQLKLNFNAPYTGNLHLYAVDWEQHATRDHHGQRPMRGARRLQRRRLGFVPARRCDGRPRSPSIRRSARMRCCRGSSSATAALRPLRAVSSAPKGNWVGTLGTAGYDLLAFGGATDVTSPSSPATSPLNRARAISGLHRRRTNERFRTLKRPSVSRPRSMTRVRSSCI